MPKVHPTAIVSDEAELHESVEIGPYCVIEGRVRMGEGVRVLCQAHVCGPATIGAGTMIYAGATIGNPPQDYKVKPGDPTAGVVIGENCIIREHVTIHAASNDHTPTTIGNNVFMMVGSHAGHDAKVGNNVVMVNYAVLGGHAQVGDNANLSGLVAIHQHGRVGRLAMISGGSGMSMDVPPFCVAGERNVINGVNVVGMRRFGMDRGEIQAVKRAFHDVFRLPLTRGEQIEKLERMAANSPAVGEMLEFVKTAKRAISRGPLAPPRSAPWVRAVLRGEIGVGHGAESGEDGE